MDQIDIGDSLFRSDLDKALIAGELPQKITLEDRSGRSDFFRDDPESGENLKPGDFVYLLHHQDHLTMNGKQYFEPNFLTLLNVRDVRDDGSYRTAPFRIGSHDREKVTTNWEEMLGHIFVRNNVLYFSRRAEVIAKANRVNIKNRLVKFREENDPFLNPETYWSVIKDDVQSFKDSTPTKEHQYEYGKKISYVWTEENGAPIALVANEKIRSLDLSHPNPSGKRLNTYHTNLSDNVHEGDIRNLSKLKLQFPEVPILRTNKEKVLFYKQRLDQSREKKRSFQALVPPHLLPLVNNK